MKPFISGIFLALTFLLPLHAQTVTNAPATDTNSVVANPIPAGQAPDEVVKKLSSLVHDGKYAEAQQLASGLLLAYPDDQRLIKAKTLLDKLIAASNSTQPTNGVAEPVASTPSDQLTDMDKVEYNALIQRAKEAQQTTDLDQQKILLKQFIDDSSQFLQKHPDQMLLWQFRAVSAIILDDMTDGYDAGQKLLAAGAADSNDANLQQLLAQLKNKGWLDKEKMDQHKIFEGKEKKFSWLLGTWKGQWRWKIPYYGALTGPRDYELFSLADSTIDGYEINQDGTGKASAPDLRGVILDTGEIKWECYLIPYNPGRGYVFRYTGSGFMTPVCYMAGNIDYHYYQLEGTVQNGPAYPSEWQPVISFESGLNTNTLNIIIPSQSSDPKSNKPLKYPVTLTFTKNGDSHN
jgi:hypothetical protein